MKTKLWTGLSLALIVAMLVTGLALADKITADADALVLSSPHPNGVTTSQNGGTTVSYDFSAVIENTGSTANDVFADSDDSVSVTVTKTGSWLSGGTAGPFSFTAYLSPQAGTIDITVPCGSEGTAETMTVDLVAVASNGQTLSPNSQSLSYVITAGPDDPSCAPSDTTPPTITITTPPDGAVYLLNEVVLADYFCEDEVGGSGLASCVGMVANGAAIDTSSVGSYIFTVDAADIAGNTNSASAYYSVIYDFRGFFQPVDNPEVLNKVKAGSAIPVKFSLSGNQGLDIFAAGFPTSVTIACPGSTPDTIETISTASTSGLTYDAAADQYVYVWKTEKAWSGTCRQLVVKLDDGTEHLANFWFVK